MFPVDEPPRVRVPILNDWIVALLPVRDRPLPAPPPNVADIDAVGVPSLIPVTANSAVEVAVEPRRKSRVDASLGYIAPAATFQCPLVPVVVFDMKLPLHVRLPVSPARVQPVEALPPARTNPPEPTAPPRFIVVAVVFNRLKVA